MRVKYLAALILILVTHVAATMPKNPVAVLKDIRKQYKSIKNFRCDFTEQFQWQFTGELVTRNGTMIAAEGDRFRMETPEQVMVCDGTSLFRYNLLKNQVMIESVKEASNLLPRRFLLEFGGEFEATELSPISVEGREGFRLTLDPLKADESFMSKAAIWVTTSDLIIHKMQMDDLNGNRTTYILQNIVIDKPVVPKETSFTIPEGAELFDLR